MIIKHEGFNPRCYWDGGGYSQGYGHKCLGGSISRTASRRIVERECERLNYMVKTKLSVRQRAGAVSFLYNHPINQHNYVWMINNDLAKFQEMLKVKVTTNIYINGVRQGGLKSRRAEEYQYIFGQ